MSLRIKSDGIYVDDVLQIPTDKQVLVDGVYDKLTQNGIKTINGESVLGNGNIDIQTGLLQTVFLSENESYYFNTTNEVELPSLNTVITPKSDNSYFLVIANLNLTKLYVGSVTLKFRDSFVETNQNNNSSTNAISTRHTGGSSTSYFEQYPIVYAVENNSLEDAYIGVYARNVWSGRKYSFYYNNRSSGDMQSTSTCIIMEVQR